MSAKLDNAQKKDTDEIKPSQTGEAIIQIPLDEMFPLRGHPFSVNDDELMEQIRQMPGVVDVKILSGH